MWQVIRPIQAQTLAINPHGVESGIDGAKHVVTRMITDIDDLFGQHLEAFGQVLVNQWIRFGEHNIRGTDGVPVYRKTGV